MLVAFFCFSLVAIVRASACSVGMFKK